VAATRTATRACAPRSCREGGQHAGRHLAQGDPARYRRAPPASRTKRSRTRVTARRRGRSFCNALTDNRTARRRSFATCSQAWGNLGESGCVASCSRNRDSSSCRERRRRGQGHGSGARGRRGGLFADDPEFYEIYTAPEELHKVKTALESHGLTGGAGKVEMVRPCKSAWRTSGPNR